CEFEGDVTGPEVVVSERGKVTGNVAADRVIVLGKIVGDIRGKMVALLSTAHVQGDIYHASVAIDEGAEFAGRCRHTDVRGWSDARKNAAQGPVPVTDAPPRGIVAQDEQVRRIRRQSLS